MIGLQEKSDDFGAVEFAGPGEAVLHLLKCGGGLEAAVGLEKCLDHVQPADTAGPFEDLELGAAGREVFGRPSAAVLSKKCSTA